MNIFNVLKVAPVMAVIAGCAIASEPKVALIRLKPDPSHVRATAAKEGKLEVHKGCVYFVSKSSKARVLPIWESSYELWMVDGKAVGVQDTQSGEKLKFGVNHTFGGGEATGDLGEALEKPIPEPCDGTRGYTYF